MDIHKEKIKSEKNCIMKNSYQIFFQINAFTLGMIFQWDKKIAPVNQVWLLNQMLLNQEKLTL